jgi:hypothetical protein
MDKTRIGLAKRDKTRLGFAKKDKTRLGLAKRDNIRLGLAKRDKTRLGLANAVFNPVHNFATIVSNYVFVWKVNPVFPS